MFQNFEKICLSIWIFFICWTEHLVGLFSVRLLFFSCRNLFTMFLIIFYLLFVSILSGILCFQRLELLGLIFSLLFSIFSSFLLSGRFPWLYLLIFRMYFIYLIFYLIFFFIFLSKSISFSSYKSLFSLKIRVWGHLFLFSFAPSVWVRPCGTHRQGVQGRARRPGGLG